MDFSSTDDWNMRLVPTTTTNLWGSKRGFCPGAGFGEGDAGQLQMWGIFCREGVRNGSRRNSKGGGHKTII